MRARARCVYMIMRERECARTVCALCVCALSVLCEHHERDVECSWRYISDVLDGSDAVVCDTDCVWCTRERGLIERECVDGRDVSVGSDDDGLVHCGDGCGWFDVVGVEDSDTIVPLDKVSLEEDDIVVDGVNDDGVWIDDDGVDDGSFALEELEVLPAPWCFVDEEDGGTPPCDEGAVVSAVDGVEVEVCALVIIIDEGEDTVLLWRPRSPRTGLLLRCVGDDGCELCCRCDGGGRM